MEMLAHCVCASDRHHNAPFLLGGRQGRRGLALHVGPNTTLLLPSTAAEQREGDIGAPEGEKREQG